MAEERDMFVCGMYVCGVVCACVYVYVNVWCVVCGCDWCICVVCVSVCGVWYVGVTWCVYLWNGVCEECMYVFVWYVCNMVRVYVCGVCECAFMCG